MPRRLAQSIAAALVATAVAAASAIAGPAGGARYSGTSAAHTPVSFRVAPDGRRLAAYRFVATTRCTNGESGTVVFRSAPRAPVIRIRRGGFSVRFHALAAVYDARAGRQVVGTHTDAVSGRFRSRRRATGSVRIRFRSRDGRLRCDSGVLPYAVRGA